MRKQPLLQCVAGGVGVLCVFSASAPGVFGRMFFESLQSRLRNTHSASRMAELDRDLTPSTRLSGQVQWQLGERR
jgi:hypothetical protein